MTRQQAIAFADKLIGTELCSGAGEDEAAQYVISPIVRSFIEGALGTENVFGGVHVWAARQPERLRPLAQFLIDAGTALLPPGDASVN